MPRDPIQTIGYEGTTLDAVLTTLRAAGTRLLLDVRAVASSRKPGFSKTLLASSAQAAGIGYVHLRGLGTPKAGRQAVRRGDVAGMVAIFGAHMRTEPALADLSRAEELVAQGPVCLLCFEHDHRTCHRAIVAGLLAERCGATVDHLDPWPRAGGDQG